MSNHSVTVDANTMKALTILMGKLAVKAGVLDVGETLDDDKLLELLANEVASESVDHPRETDFDYTVTEVTPGHFIITLPQG